MSNSMTFLPATHGQVFTFLWRFLRSRKLMLACMTFLLITSTIVELVQPFFYKEALDTIVQTAVPTVETFRYALLMILTGVLFGVFGITENELSFSLLAKLETKVMREIWAEAFARVQRLSTQFHMNAFAGATSRKIGRGVDAIEGMMDVMWFSFLPLVVLVFGFVVVLFFYIPMMALIIICCIAVYVPLSIWSSLIVARHQTEADAQDTATMANMVDAITGNPTVKSHAGERYEEERHEAAVADWQRKTWRAWRLGTIVSWTQSMMMMMIELLLLSFAVFLWYRGSFTAGGFIIVMFYVGKLWGYMHDIGKSTRNYLKATAHAREMVGLCSQTVEVKDVPGARALIIRKGEIRFDHVTFAYGDTLKPVFQDFSLSIPAGEKMAIVGHSGGGKSTLVKLLQRLYDPKEGAILIDGQNIAEVTQESLRKAIGLVPQDPILFHRSIAENIAYGKLHASQDEIIAAAKKAHAHEFITAFPRGYETMVGERGIKLSGGERQRVAIARAFLANCPILILDEATSSLDSISEQFIQEALLALMEGRTTIVIAHRLSTIKHTDRILVIDAGRIIEEGSHAELLQKEDGVYRGFYELQAKGFIGE